jgi:hypothetical protein
VASFSGSPVQRTGTPSNVNKSRVVVPGCWVVARRSSTNMCSARGVTVRPTPVPLAVFCNTTACSKSAGPSTRSPSSRQAPGRNGSRTAFGLPHGASAATLRKASPSLVAGVDPPPHPTRVRASKANRNRVGDTGLRLSIQRNADTSVVAMFIPRSRQICRSAPGATGQCACGSEAQRESVAL